MSPVKQICIYVLYFFAAVLVFGWMTFPGKKVAMAVSEGFNKTFSFVQLEADTSSLSLPVGVVLEKSRLVFFEKLMVEPDSLQLHWPVLSVLNSNKIVKFDGQTGAGKWHGSIVGGVLFQRPLSSFSLVFSQVVVNEFVYQTPAFKTAISFTAGGNHQTAKETKEIGGQVDLMNFTADILQGKALKEIGVSEIHFDRVQIQYEVVNNKVALKTLSARGPMMNLDLKGTIHLSGKFKLRLNGHLMPTGSFVSDLSKIASIQGMFKKQKTKGIPVIISGSLSKPVMRFR